LRQALQVLYFLAPSLLTWALMFLPLSLYLLYLGLFVNRRANPKMMRGDRNFYGILFALSGFFLIGPPAWVADAFRRWGNEIYFAAYGMYLLLAASIIWAYLRQQAHSTVIFNLSPDMLPVVVRETLEDLKLPYEATAGRIALAGGHTVIDVEASAVWYSATLTWMGASKELRAQIETRLQAALAKVETTDNPCRALLLMWGIVLLAFSVFGLITGAWYLRIQWS
jgi:hypothetical protein